MNTKQIYPSTFFKVQMQDDIGGLQGFYNKSLKEKVIYRKRMKKKHIERLNLTEEEKDKRSKQNLMTAKDSFIKYCLETGITEGEEILKKAGFQPINL